MYIVAVSKYIKFVVFFFFVYKTTGNSKCSSQNNLYIVEEAQHFVTYFDTNKYILLY